MEQVKTNALSRATRSFLDLALLFLIAPFFIGCEKELPNPENLDPIYQDLVGILGLKDKALKDEEKKLEDLRKTIKNQEVRSLGLKTQRRDIIKSKHLIKSLKQDIDYYKIYSERRRLEARKAYRIAFFAKKTWPDPKEYQNYTVSKRLREAPRNWGKRIQKLLEQKPKLNASKPKP